jgi:hypothetical protein
MAYNGNYISDLDINKPDGSVEYGNILDDAIRETKRSIKNSFEAEHYSDYPTVHKFRYGNTASEGTLRKGQLYFNTEKQAIITSIDGTNNIVATTLIPSGTKALFVQNSAPNGWTFVDTWHDRVIQITSNINEAGTTGGNWVITGLTNTSEGNHNHPVPAHDTTYITHIPAPSWRQNNYTIQDDHPSWDDTHHISVDAGGNLEGQHSHRVEQQDTSIKGLHTHGINSNGQWRPAYLKVICCSKD